MEDVTSQPFYQVLEDIAQQLIYYHNCFIAKVRKEEASGGKRWTDFTGKERIPIAGYFVQDATSMEISRLQKGGRILKYKQYMQQAMHEEPEWSPDNMVHIFLDRKVGTAFGCPMIIPVLADIMALRRMEENVELLVFQYAIPFFQYRVGFPESNTYDPDEIAEVQDDINNMVTEGMFVTPPHHEIKAVGAEGRAVRVEGYLRYFKQRVFSGLGTSEVGMGEGSTSNKGTANTLSKEETDIVERYAKAICKGISHHMFRELLNEGSFDTTDENNLVNIVIPPIDMEKKMAKDNHALQMFQGNAWDEDEMREEMGREPIELDQRAKTYRELDTIPIKIIQAIDEGFLASGAAYHSFSPATNKSLGLLGKEAKAMREKALAVEKAKFTSSKTSGSNPSSKSVNSTTQRGQPTNQYGTKASTGTKVNDEALKEGSPSFTEALDNKIKDLNIDNLANRLSYFMELAAQDTIAYIEDTLIEVQDWGKHKKDFNKGRLQLTFDITEEQMFNAYKNVSSISYSTGSNEFLQSDPNIKALPKQKIDKNRKDYEEIEEWAKKDIKKIVNDVTTQVTDRIKTVSDSNDLVPNIRGVFNANRYRVDFFSRSHIWRSYVLGELHAADALGYTEVMIKPLGKNSEACEDSKTVPLNILTPRNIPPYHPNCTQVLDIKGGKKGI